MASDPIIAGLQEQVDCYRRLAKLAEKQHEHVQQDQTERLLEVLQSRQEVLDRVASLEQRVGPAKRGWSAYATGLAPEARASAEGLLAETRRLLEQITVADRNDTLVLQQRKLNLGRKINQAQSARQVNRTYAASAYGPRASKVDVQQ